MRKLTLLLLILAFALSLVSCDEIKESDEELISIASDLVKKSEIMNTVYWGKGIAYKDTSERLSEDEDDYRIADLSALAEYGIKDYDSLKKYTYCVFTQNEADNIYSTYLKRSAYTDSFAGYTYTEVFTRYQKGADGELFVRVGATNLMGDTELSFEYQSIRIISKEKKTVTFEIDVSVKNQTDRVGYKDTLTLEMRSEADGFRLNTPTYCVYFKD